MPRTLIHCQDLHKAYGADTLLDGIELAIQDDHRIGVLGRNGAGKSTLCRIILEEEAADSGRVVRHEDLRLGYLEQKDPFHDGETAGEFLERHTGAPAWRCGEAAGDFLIGPAQLATPVRSLSGGWQTRLRLASMLVREPNFLILDEPTNYLDLATLMLLEDFLKGFRGGFIIVSHDREFLRRTCGQTLEVGDGRATFHPGNIDAWLDYKRARNEQAEHKNAAVAQRRKELEEFIARNQAKASKAAQAQSKAKMLDRLDQEVVEVAHPDAEVVITLPNAEERDGSALRLDDLAIGYPGTPARVIAKGITIDLDRGSRVAVLGDNGQGKSTLLKTLAGNLAPLAGRLQWGYGIRVGHYAQHVFQAIPADQTVHQHLARCADAAPGPMITTQQVLDLAGAFLFRGDAVDKKVAVLSGGERARLCLAGLLLGRHQVLLLDEPTNHLDFATVEALAAALCNYNGTLFVVSHDRTFVKTVATHILEVKDGRVDLVGDGYDAYVWRLQQQARAAHQPRPSQRPAEPAAPAAAAATSPATGRERREAVNKVRNRIKAIERELPLLDQRRKALEAALAIDPTVYKPRETDELGEVQERIAHLEEEWLELSEQG
jgi:ATP-binding cassette subfamily F protein 3